MHKSVLEWVDLVVKKMDLSGKRTLEVGSYDVNGSVRQFFMGEYVGSDARKGPGVDIVAQASNLPFATGSFDNVVCTEVLEHDPRPWLSVPEMARVLRVGGHLIITCRGFGFPIHEYPADYWRFSTAALGLLLTDARLDPLSVTTDPDPDSPGIFALARK